MTITTSPFPLSAPVNFRDLGGIPARNGLVRPGFAWRADDMSLLDELTAEEFVDKGLSSVIDLRSSAEVENTGRGVLGNRPVQYHHIPFITSLESTFQPGKDASTWWDQSTFHEMYIGLYENSAPQIVSALAVLAYAPGAVVFHCAAGQDRTGVLAASLLLTLAADRDAIIADYAATGPNSAAIRERNRPVIGPILERLGMGADFAAKAALRSEFSAAPMAGLLDYLDETYRDPLEPLYTAGLTDALVDHLRAKGVSAD